MKSYHVLCNTYSISVNKWAQVSKQIIIVYSKKYALDEFHREWNMSEYNPRIKIQKIAIWGICARYKWYKYCTIKTNMNLQKNASLWSILVDITESPSWLFILLLIKIPTSWSSFIALHRLFGAFSCRSRRCWLLLIPCNRSRDIPCLLLRVYWNFIPFSLHSRKTLKTSAYISTIFFTMLCTWPIKTYKSQIESIINRSKYTWKSFGFSQKLPGSESCGETTFTRHRSRVTAYIDDGWVANQNVAFVIDDGWVYTNDS